MPKWCNTEENKQEYLKQFYDWHGFELDPTKIVDNPGLKNVAKLFLNSLWGKFGQRDHG